MYKKDFKLNGNGKTESRWTTQSILKTADALLTEIAKEDKRTKSAIIEKLITKSGDKSTISFV